MEQTQLLALVEKAVGGDTKAFEAIYHYKAKDILYICTQLMGNLPDGEDAAQEVFIAMQTSIGRLKKPKAFVAWSNRIIANTCKHLLRTNRRSLSAPLEDFASEIEEMHLEFLPQEFAEEKEKQKIVLDALHALSFRYRTALVLFYYEDLSNKEIAKALGTNTRSVENLLYQARKALRREIETRTGTKLAMGEFAGKLNGVLVLTRILHSDMQNLPPETVARVASLSATGVAAAGVAATGTAVATGAATAGTTAAAGAAIAVPGWAVAAITTVAAAAAITIGVSSASTPPQNLVSMPVPPTGVQAGVAEVETDGADIQAEGDTHSPAVDSDDALAALPVSPDGLGGGASFDETTTPAPPSNPLPATSSGGGAAGAESTAPAGKDPGGSAAVTYTGSFVFVGASGPLQRYNSAAQGFGITVYSGDRAIATATADETGTYAFTLHHPPARFTIEAHALYGCGPATESAFTLVVDADETSLPAIEFTDTQPPSAAVYFYDDTEKRLEGSLNPARATVRVHDATSATVAWRIEDDTGATVQSGKGGNISFATLQPPAGLREYRLVCILTDVAGNTATVERTLYFFSLG